MPNTYGFDDPQHYQAAPHARAAFGDGWCLEDGTAVPKTPQLCACYEGGECTVEVYRTAWPASFYTIQVVGGSPAALTTGSGQHELAATVAKALADGMLAFSGRSDSNTNNLDLE